MSEAEAIQLIEKNEGRLCVRLYRRKDGTVIVDNCPVGLRKVRDRVAKVAVVAAFLLSIGWLSGQEAHSQGLVGAPPDAGRLGSNEVWPIQDYVEDAKDKCDKILLFLLFWLKLAVTVSGKYKWTKQSKFLFAYLFPLFCASLVHFTYLGMTDEIVLTILQGLVRSLTTGVTFGLSCLLAAVIQDKLSGNNNKKRPGQFIS